VNQPPGVAICVHGLGDNWLGGVNYYKNLLRVFDEANDSSLRLHLCTDSVAFLGGAKFSARVQVHELPMLRAKSPAWAWRKARQVLTGRDGQLLGQLRKLGVRAVAFSFVQGAREAGMTCLPWVPDFQSQQLPDLFPPGVAQAEARRTRRWLHQANGLVLSSRSALADAQQFFEADPQQMHVLQFAPHVDFSAIGGLVERDAVLRRHGIDEPYFFLPNQYWMHKNHGLVVQALAQLKARGTPPLVVSTGKTADPRYPAHYAAFEQSLQQHGLQGRYRVLGVVSRQDMMVLMAHSRAVLNPSRFEGWSTTVEEAKALGKALILSDIAVHREQTEGRSNAWRFAADDASALAHLLQTAPVPSNNLDACAPHFDVRPHAAFQSNYLQLLRQLARLPAAESGLTPL
jgi:hypothetical protein